MLESEVLETLSEHLPPPPAHYGRRSVFVFVDSFDLAALAALRYARSLRPTTLRAVHFVIDNVQAEEAQAEVDQGRPRRAARLHRRLGLQADPGRRRNWSSGKPPTRIRT